MKTFNTIGIFVALAWLASAGCVTQQHADDIETQYRKAQEQLVELQAQVETYRAHVNALETPPPNPDQQTLDELANAQATLSQLEAELAKHNPIDRLAPLAKAKVPIFHIHGDKDRVVPLDKNSAIIKERYDKLGAPMTLEVVPGQGHNMWSGWFQSQNLVDFLIAHATR